MRDKVIGLVLVVVIAGIVWYVGARSRPAPRRAASTDAATSAPALRDAETDGALVDGDAPIVDAGAAEDATLASSAACRAMADASKRMLDEALAAGLCVDLSPADLQCATSRDGATWGIRIDDVTDLDADAAACPTGWLERVVHVAADGSEQAIVPPGPGGVRHGHRYNVYKGAPVYARAFFDWNGDGEDEVVIGRWTSVFVYTFARGRIVPYAPASRLSIAEVKDVDGDGRPDFLVRPFGDAPPTTIELLAHSLPDGTFTLHDALAVERAQKLCPIDAPVPLVGDEQILADDVACSLLWGHDPKALRDELCGTGTATCFPWVKPMLASKPPLSLR